MAADWQDYIEEQLITLNQLEGELSKLDWDKDQKRIMPLMGAIGEIVGELTHMGVPRELIDKARKHAADGAGGQG